MTINIFYYFREDGKDCMKFYTDPGYFFELWFAEIKKDIDTKRAELKKRRDRKVGLEFLFTI